MTPCLIAATVLLVIGLAACGVLGEYANAELRAVVAQLGPQTPAPAGVENRPVRAPGPASSLGEGERTGPGTPAAPRWWTP